MTESTAAMYSIALWNESQQSSQTESNGGFWNYGYWRPDTTNAAAASEQLLDHLIGKLPPSASRVLDVAFGKGRSTRRLCEIFGDQSVVGINIGKDQLEAARRRGVRCELRIMDAAQLQFADETFDAVLCIEAAFHFRTRARFLERSRAILRPGGRLVMSDLLFRCGHGLSAEVFPPENEVHSLEEYLAVFCAAGFAKEHVQIERTTERQMVPYIANLAKSMGALQFQTEERIGGNLSRGDMWTVWFMLSRLLNVMDCVVVTASKL